MTLRLRNTLSRTVEPVRPRDGATVRMYTCGPTVYRYAHVGNLRSNLLADLIRRALLYHGLAVLHVKNITDVGHMREDDVDRGEDRMLIQAGLEGRSSAEIADAYEAAFHHDEHLVNILPAHVFPRATDHIPEMVALAERLEDLGHAYASDLRNVYYAVGTFEVYGRLSRNTLDELRAGHRGEIEPDKRDPADFALWKAAGPHRVLRWPTERWGDGFPGWHLECSAMAMRYLGDHFDIHTGGVDNIFPHHEDEIAQSAPVVGGPPADLWVHGAHLLMDGRKMAKSAGNFQRITELIDEGFDPLAFRYLVLTSRYARTLDYSDASLASAARGLTSLRAGLAAMGPPPGEGPWSAPAPVPVEAAGDRPTEVRAADPAGLDRAHAPAAPLTDAGRVLHDRFAAAIDDDLDLPKALAVARAILKADLSDDERRWLLLDADAILGLDLHTVWDDGGPGEAIPSEVSALVEARTAARAARDFAQADAIRAEIEGLGWSVVDGPDGPVVSRS